MNTKMYWCSGRRWVLAMTVALPMIAAEAQQGTKFGRRPSDRKVPARNPMTDFSNQIAGDMRKAIEDAALQNPAFQNAELEGTEQVKPLDFRALGERLPEMVGDLNRVRVTGENVDAVGVVMAQVAANYASPDRERQLRVTIYDIGGGLPGVDPEDIAQVKTVTIDNETEEGYDRTREIEGFKAIERLHRATQTGEISVIVGERVGVRVQGKGVSMGTIEAGVMALNLPELAKIGS